MDDDSGVLTDLVLDRDSPVPLYHQVMQRLESAIEAGELKPGARLDNEIDIARRLGLSRPTLRMAIAKLVDQGLLIRRRGIGTVVAPAQLCRPVGLTSLHDELMEAGRRPVTQVLGLRVLRAPVEIAAALQLPAGASVVHIRRLRLADGEPIALMTNFLPEHVVEVTAAELERTGLYQLLRRRAIHPRIANQSLGARLAGAAEARLLAVRRGAPLVTLRRTAFDHACRAIEHGIHVYPAERYTLDMTVVRR